MKPVRLKGWTALRSFAWFVTNPVLGTRRIHQEYGPFVELTGPRRSKGGEQSAILMIADSELYREMLTDTDKWRNTQIVTSARWSEATRRLSKGVTRLTGERHAYYRKLLTPPLKRPPILALAPDMARTAAEHVASWPTDIPLITTHIVKPLTSSLATYLVLGDDLQRAKPIVELSDLAIQASLPLPTPAFFRYLVKAAELEQALLSWAEDKRGQPQGRDILSIIANAPDESGNPPSAEIIGGITGFVFAAAYDTCQNTLSWTLLMLSQYPEIAQALAAEIDDALEGGPVTIQKVGELPMLNNVVRETMRLFTPIPITMRKSTRPASLGGVEVGAAQRVVIAALEINCNPTMYPDPHEFRPQRWDTIKPTPFEYTVFGAGGRMCPGVTFGLQLVKLAIATIVSQRVIELAPRAKVDYRLRVTLQPAGNVSVILRHRGAPYRRVPLRGRIRDLVRLEA